MILLRYILRNHAVPFLFANVALMGLFLLQFLMKSADRIIGKGLDILVILQLVAYNLAWMVVLVVPMSVLVATLMAFGGMSQTNEITIMKASGVSLPRMIIGPLISGVVVAYLLMLFNNDVLPDANHKAKILMFDISQKKPTLSLQPGVFSQEMQNIAILAREVDQNSNNMFGVTIYDYSEPGKLNIITAQKGRLYFTPDMVKLVLDLDKGEIHEAQTSGTNMYRKIYFKRHRIAMEAGQYSLQRSRDIARGDRELSAEVMLHIVDSLNTIAATYQKNMQTEINRAFKGDSTQKPVDAASQIARKNERDLNSVLGVKIRSSQQVISAAGWQLDRVQKEIDSFMVEVHKKYAIPVACIIFVLLGAPLGVMSRKGGFGMAGSISIFFFLIYWAFLIGGEKLADRGLVTPFWGMWSANFVMGALGLFLLYRSVKENITINFDWFKRFVPKHWRSAENDTN
ncbi:MAG: LptF/LptG family permease [Ignavibacteriales bacterium]|nr:LptF/LptG family permease [Ignavibacteriales bacterium]